MYKKGNVGLHSVKREMQEEAEEGTKGLSFLSLSLSLCAATASSSVSIWHYGVTQKEKTQTI